MTLTEFLLARIAEDERFWNAARDSLSRLSRVEGDVIEHELAECEAKRHILRDARLYIRAADDAPDDERKQGAATVAEGALSYLASIYADHPDYRDEWRV